MTNIDKGIIIRKAEAKDIEAIHNILTDAFTPYHKDYSEKAYRITVSSTDVFRERLKDPDKRVFVAQVKDEIVGTATIDISKNSIYLQNMAVRSRIQRRGIGIAILETIERYAQEHGIKKIILECYEPLAKAIKLYRKFGFKRTGKTRSYYGISIFEMKKVLPGVID